MTPRSEAWMDAGSIRYVAKRMTRQVAREYYCTECAVQIGESMECWKVHSSVLKPTDGEEEYGFWHVCGTCLHIVVLHDHIVFNYGFIDYRGVTYSNREVKS